LDVGDLVKEKDEYYRDCGMVGIILSTSPTTTEDHPWWWVLTHTGEIIEEPEELLEAVP